LTGFRGFPQSLQPRLLPSISFPINYSIIILPTDAYIVWMTDSIVN
jgi:hypothetical protein